MCIKRAQPNSYFDPELEVDNEERSFLRCARVAKKRRTRSVPKIIIVVRAAMVVLRFGVLVLVVTTRLLCPTATWTLGVVY